LTAEGPGHGAAGAWTGIVADGRKMERAWAGEDPFGGGFLVGPGAFGWPGLDCPDSKASTGVEGLAPGVPLPTVWRPAACGERVRRNRASSIRTRRLRLPVPGA